MTFSQIVKNVQIYQIDFMSPILFHSVVYYHCRYMPVYLIDSGEN